MDSNKGYSIAFKGLKIGSHEFDFKVGDSFFEEFEGTEIKGGDCAVNVALERAESQLLLDVAIEGEVIVACDRCLDDCAVPIDFEGTLVVKFSDEPQEYDGEILWLLPGEDEVDLKQYIYESIVLSLPYQRVHSDGECNPDMMERFSIVSEDEFARIEADMQPEEEHCGGQWDKLAALKKQMEENETAEGSPDADPK